MQHNEYFHRKKHIVMQHIMINFSIITCNKAFSTTPHKKCRSLPVLPSDGVDLLAKHWTFSQLATYTSQSHTSASHPSRSTCAWPRYVSINYSRVITHLAYYQLSHKCEKTVHVVIFPLVQSSGKSYQYSCIANYSSCRLTVAMWMDESNWNSGRGCFCHSTCDANTGATAKLLWILQAALLMLYSLAITTSCFVINLYIYNFLNFQTIFSLPNCTYFKSSKTNMEEIDVLESTDQPPLAEDNASELIPAQHLYSLLCHRLL